MKIFQKVASRIPFIDEKNRVITSLRDDLERIEGNNQQLTDEKTDLGKKLFSVNQQRYQNILGLLNLKFKKGKQIRVAFFVMFDSAFANQSVYEEMMKDDFFDPIIVVVPDLSRGI